MTAPFRARLTLKQQAARYRRWAAEAQAQADRYRAGGQPHMADLTMRDHQKFDAMARAAEAKIKETKS